MSTRAGDFSMNARFDMRRPVRSNWLDSQLPSGWLCLAVPQARTLTSSEREPCEGNEARYVGALGARVLVGSTQLHLGGTLIHTAGAPGLERMAAYAVVRHQRPGPSAVFVEGSLSATGGLVLASYSARAEAGGLLFGGQLELSGHYRASLARYRAELGYWNQHRVGLSAEWRGPVVLRLDADGWLAPDVQGVSTLLTASWHL